MKKEKILTQKYLKECLHYDPETGIFTWKERSVSHFKDGKKQTAEHKCKSWNNRYIGKCSGSFTTKGYIEIGLLNYSYLAHRLAWLYMDGYFPENMIDHEDQDKSNNKWDNLREASNMCNQQNCKIRNDNKSGVTGVTWSKDKQKWRVYIRVNKVAKYLGIFEELKDAVQARYNEEQNNPLWKCSTESSAYKYLKKVGNSIR